MIIGILKIKDSSLKVTKVFWLVDRWIDGKTILFIFVFYRQIFFFGGKTAHYLDKKGSY